jgi:hypothetical protein
VVGLSITMGCGMLDLFKTNSAICTRMAAAATSPEVRQQWNELATHWQMKAEANISQTNAPEREAGQVEVSRPSPVATKTVAEMVVSSTPTIEPHSAARVVPTLVPHEERAALEAIWQAIQAPAKSTASVST